MSGYVGLGAASLGLLLLVLLERGQNLVVSALILIVGAVGLLNAQRLAPILVLALVTVNELFKQFGSDIDLDSELLPVFRVGDVVLCAALLGYVAAQYRIQGLSHFILPADDPPEITRNPSRTPLPRKRSGHSVTSQELSLLAVSLPFWAILAQLVWTWLNYPRVLLGWDWRVARAAVCLLGLIACLWVTNHVLDYARRRRMTLAEARLLLQDTLWNETRGEQRWFARWLAWFWLHCQSSRHAPRDDVLTRSVRTTLGRKEQP
jgi:hypothetical protein